MVGTNHEKVNSLHPITPDIPHVLSCLAEAIIERLAKLAEMVLDADIASLPRIRHLTFARALTCISNRIGKLEAQCHELPGFYFFARHVCMDTDTS
jgi:hypothetical protein